MKTECIVTTFCDNGRGSQRVMNLFKNENVYFISVDEVVGEPFAYKIVSRVIEYIIHAETDRAARAYALSAWRNPVFERLINILKTTNLEEV